MVGDLLQGGVGIAQALGLHIGLLVQLAIGDGQLKLGQVFKAGEEPAVDLGDLMNGVHRPACLKGFENREEAAVILMGKAHLQRLVGQGLGVEGIEANLRAADRLHNAHLKAGGNGHDLAGGLHLGAQLPAGAVELVKGPLGELHHHVIHRRLKARASLASDVVGDLVEIVAQGDLGGDFGDGVAGCLAGQRRGAGDTGVHFDDGVLKAVGIESKLAVAAADDAEGGDDIQRGLAEHLILLVRQGEGGGNHNGVAGVDAHGVEVLHAAHGNDVAGAVAHGFKLNFFPALDIPLHQNLGDGGHVQAGAGNDTELLFAVGHAAAGAAKGKGRADDHRVADAVSHRQSILQRFGNVRGDGGLADGGHGVLKELAILGLVDGLGVGAQEAHAVSLQEALLAQLHGDGEPHLAAEPGEHAVGLLLFDDALDGLGREGLQVDLVGQGAVGHDGGGVGVDQHHVQSGVLQDTAGLGAGIVKLGGLADDDGTRADDQYLFDVFIQRHSSFPPSCP